MLIWHGRDTFSLAKRREKQKHLLVFSMVEMGRAGFSQHGCLEEMFSSILV